MATATVRATTVGVFSTHEAADRAIADLKKAGYRDDQIGLVAKDASGKTVKTDGTGETHATEGAAIGAATGAGAAALVSLGLSFGVIPVIGPILAVGPLAAALISAVGGAAAAGIAGALIGWGIPEEDAKYYEGEVKAGRFLVTVDRGTQKTDDTREIFSRHGGYDRTTASAKATGQGDAGSSARTAVTGEQTVRLHEEQLKANKQTVNAGEVEIRKEVHTAHKTITVPVEREELVIERHKVNATGRAGDIGNEEIRIPLKEEKVTVTKDTVVKEEVSVGKRKVQGTETVGGDIRSEELIVESEGKTTVRDETSKKRS
jgi:uncharacterized protein (TIGR02271 family)